MHKDDILYKIKMIYGDDKVSSEFIDILKIITEPEIPVFRFALREDIADQKQFLPTKAEPKAAGFDVRAAIKEPLILKPFQKALIPLGFRSFCPENWWFELKPRSSTFHKKSLHTLIGTVDETFEGQVMLAVQYIPQNIIGTIMGTYDVGRPCILDVDNLTINPGDALGQIIPLKINNANMLEVSNIEYNELCKNRNGQRGEGGFGSTSK